VVHVVVVTVVVGHSVLEVVEVVFVQVVVLVVSVVDVDVDEMSVFGLH